MISVKSGGGKTSELLCKESWSMNTGIVEHSTVSHEPYTDHA